jgi:16S rRNA (cytidine1402-2'-O)-methyltransferase
VETLNHVNAVLAEDTRHTRPLLQRYEIATPLIAYHEHNEAKTTPRLVERLVSGERLALVSDAGTPLLSDPGQRLVQAAIGAGVPVIPIPGASAMLAALVASGLDLGRFTFFGFLARSGRERQEGLSALAALPHTAVLYEAPARLADTLAELVAGGGADRACAVAREMTKHFEEVRRGTVGELAAYYQDTPVKGEVVVVLGEAPERVVDETVIRARVRELRGRGMSARDVAAAVADEFGVSKRVGYRMGLE